MESRLTNLALRQRIEELEENAAQEALSILHRIVKLTTDIFGRQATVYNDFDPEFPEDDYTVVRVFTPLSTDELLEAESRWNAEIDKISPQIRNLRLSVYPQD